MDWNDGHALGRALRDAYPSGNYVTVSDAELIDLVTALPGFGKTAVPPDAATLMAVRLAWVAAAEGEDDTSPYEGGA